MCSQQEKYVKKNAPFSRLFIWDTVGNWPMTVQHAVKMQSVPFQLHFGNEDTDMEPHSAHHKIHVKLRNAITQQIHSGQFGRC